MSLYLSANGNRVSRLSLGVPYYGVWEADIETDTTNPITGPVSLVIANLTLNGTVYRTNTFAGITYARLVGGAGGWRQSVPSQAYANPSGVLLSIVMRDVASLVGETVSISSDVIVGQFFTREAAPAQRMLRQLCGPEWYINNAGVTVIGARQASATIASSFTVIAWDPGRGLADVATEDVASWAPGNTFQSATMPAAQTIGFVRVESSNDGILRLKVLTTP